MSLTDNPGASPACKGSCQVRLPGDDFFCLRYQVWYSSRDCAVRTRYRTAPGCLRCDQGRFNYKRHKESVARVRIHFQTGSGDS